MDLQNVCRTCLRVPQVLLPLFEDPVLVSKIETISSVQVRQDDNLPSTICGECVSNINKLFNFRKVIINSDLELKERLEAIKNTEAEKASVSENIDADGKDNFVDTSVKLEVEHDMSSASENENTSDTISFRSLIEMNPPSTKGNRSLVRLTAVHFAKDFNCDKCDFTTKDRYKWRSHKQTFHGEPGICNICGKTMRKDNLSKHVRSHTAEFKCEECNIKFTNYEALRSHTYKHKGQELPCEICGKIFYYHGDLNRHVKKHLIKPIQKRVNCSICNKEMEKRAMKKHIRSHTGERPYPCEYCKKNFSSSNALKTHVRQHTNERPYICEYCPMAFPQKVSLVTHIRSKHKKDNEESAIKGEVE